MILKSKFIKIFIAIILVIALALGLVMGWQPGGQELSAEQMAELTGEHFETIFPIGRYKEIYVADWEKGLFLVENGGSRQNEAGRFSLIDKDGNLLSSLPYSHVQEHAGSSFVMVEEGRWYYINAEVLAKTGQLPQESHDRVELDGWGKYVLFKDGDQYVVAESEGKEVYTPQDRGTGSKGSYFMGPEGYIIERDPDDRQYIVNVRTGETEYEVPAKIRAAAYKGGLWFMDCAGETDGLNFSYYYALDEDFNLTADGGIFTAYNISSDSSDKYVSVQQEYDVDYSTRDALADMSLFNVKVSMKRVYNSEGQLVYGGDEEEETYHGGFIRYIRGNMLAVSDYTEKKVDYIDLDTGEVVLEDSEIFCYMDFGDGAAAAVMPRRTEDRDGRGGDLLRDEKEMKKYKWGLVDENLQPLTEFVFDGVYPGNKGYAVVIKDGQKGLIRLKGVR